jgi:hypothetical protein
MVALTLCWRIEQVSPLRPLASQAALALDTQETPFQGRIGLAFEPVAWPVLRIAPQSPAAVFAQLRLADRRGAADGRNQPALVTPALPAGRYGLEVRRVPGEPPGPIQIIVGRSGEPLRTLESPFLLELAAPVDSLTVRSGRDPLRPGDVAIVSVSPGTSPLGRGERALRASAYGDAAVYFVDDRVFPEASGFWVRPGGGATVLVASPGPFSLLLRNAPVANRVTVDAPGQSEGFDLNPGEERAVELTDRATAIRLRIRAERGVRPADLEPGNRDLRSLGVWVEVRER